MVEFLVANQEVRVRISLDAPGLNMLELEQYCIDCDCSSVEHKIYLNVDKAGIFDDNEPTIYVHYFLEAEVWYKRLILGIKYIFGYKSKYGHFGESIWTKKQAMQVKDILTKVYEE